MGFYAVEELEESFEDVKELLFPFNAVLWLKIAVIVIFIGGGMSSFPGSPGDIDVSDSDFDFELPELDFVSNIVLLSVLVGVIGFVLVFSYISAVFEFIFYQSLNDRNVAIIENFRKHALNGLKYFLFNLLMIFAWVISFVTILGAVTYSFVLGFMVLLLMIPVWIVFWLISFYVKNMTLPDMVIKGSGFREGLKNALANLRGETRQSIIFPIVKIFLGIATTLIIGLTVLAGAILLGVPLLLIGVLLYLVWAPLVALPILAGIIGLAVISLGITVPVQTYIYTWVLNVYGNFVE